MIPYLLNAVNEYAGQAWEQADDVTLVTVDIGFRIWKIESQSRWFTMQVSGRSKGENNRVRYES